MTNGLIAVPAASGLMASSGIAFAEQTVNDAHELPRTKISLIEAVAAAEAKTAGHATRAQFENSAEGWTYDVEVVAGDAVSDVHVNAQTGAVLSVTEDQTDVDEQDPAD